MMQVTQKIGRNNPCPCDSGKKYKQCCGNISTAKKLRATSDQLFADAIQLLQAGHHAEAAGKCQQVLVSQPRHTGANYILGYQALEMGDYVKAIALMGRAIEAGLRDPAAFYHYGNAFAKTGRYTEAATQFALAVHEKNDFEAARNNLANAYFELGAFPEAGEQYKKVIKQNPKNWIAHHNLAHVYYCLGDVNEAIHYFQQTVQDGLIYAEAYASLATMLELNNQVEEAENAAQRALQLQPGNASAQSILAKCLRRKRLYEEALKTLDAIDPNTASERTYITIYNERGHNLDQLGCYGAAYQSFTQSKKIHAGLRHLNYDAARQFKPLDQAEAYFSQKKISQLQKLIGAPTALSPTPLFVMGFHRSGTTLIEQILSSHPEIGAAGEVDFLSQFEATLVGNAFDLPTALENLLTTNNAKPLLDLRQQYMAALIAKADSSGKRWVVDKTLFNMLHLPLIHLLFPSSPIVHVVRHPLDTLLSVYSQNFLWGNDWSFTMPDAAHAFDRTWRHVQLMMPALEGLHYFKIHYEDVTVEPEVNIRRMLAFIGVAYHPACINFHKNKRVARTASYEQVARPIYSSSIERYLNYLPYIEPEVISSLRPATESMGYSIQENIELKTPTAT